jgi:hypothetical protein
MSSIIAETERRAGATVQEFEERCGSSDIKVETETDGGNVPLSSNTPIGILQRQVILRK